MKERIKKLDRIWIAMLCVAMIDLALIIIALIWRGEWNVALLTTTLLGVLWVLHNNRKIACELLKQWIKAAVDSDFRQLDKNLSLHRHIKNKNLVINTTLSALYGSDPVKAKKLAIDAMSLQATVSPRHKIGDVQKLIQKASRAETCAETLALMEKLNKLIDE